MLRSHLVLDDAIEAAAVHRPQLAAHPGFWPLGGPDVVVEPVEVERGTDPGDPDDDMEPSHRQVEPLLNVTVEHGHEPR